MTRKIEKKLLPLELKFADSSTDTKSFTGYGAKFGNTDHTGDVIAPGAFKKSLAKHAAAGTMPLMFLNHDAFSIPIGVWKSMSEDTNGLLVEGELIDTSAGRDTYVALKSGAISGLSIGFWVVGYEMDGKSRTITEADLMEVSVVTFPCNEEARVNFVKMKGDNMEKPSDDELKSMLAEAGFGEDDVKSLFDKRDAPVADDEVKNEDVDGEDDEESKSEAKYDEAAVVAAIKQLVATTKEMHVR